ncbi:WD repeat-containing protein wat1 [Panicum miliaceum]|uniref:Target of rapamycin complex subunit LST8 n=1 Tax=Panicum miliaceum TaxID=4540 RepID=A0A3L6SIG5_PANMI|nr:WD repeat-containing protein wat1 [Panicum miliaceum]
MPAQSQQLRHGSAGSQPPPPSTPGACSSRVPIQTTGGAHVSVSQPEALYGATRRCAWAAPAPQDSGGSQPPLAIQHPRRLASASPSTASYDHTIRFWEAKSGRCYRTIQYPDSQVNRLEITPDKRFLAAAGNPHIRLFDVNSNSPQPVISYDSHTSNVMAVGFHCDGNWMYSGSEDGTVRIWDLRTATCQREYESRAAVNTVVLHPNQKELISGDQNGNIRVWDLAANSCSCELVPEVDTAVRSLTVMWDGSMVVAANNRGTCYVWRLLKGTQTITCFEPLHKLQAHDGYILKCLLSPEFCDPNRYLATASSDNTVKIWNVDGFKLERTLVASSDTTARLWTMSTGEAIRVYQGHHKATVCCALHDGAESAPS